MKLFTDVTLPPSFKVGEFEIQRIVEMRCHFRPIAKMFPLATPEEIEGLLPDLQPWALAEDTRLILDIQSYLVRTPKHTILIDTCVGCDKNMTRIPQWAGLTDRGWLDRLGQAGVAPEDVTHVLSTHIHPDHSGWNTLLVDGRWVPTFPNATYVFTDVDIENCKVNEDEIYQESVRPIIEAGQAEIVSMDHQIDDGIWFEPTPGHTAGHVSVHLQSGDEHAVTWGDVLHSPAQCTYPHWSYARDVSAEDSVASRRRILDACADHNYLVLSSHFPGPSTGYIRRDGDGFRFEYDDREGETS